jgi:hypothetical protein
MNEPNPSLRKSKPEAVGVLPLRGTDIDTISFHRHGFLPAAECRALAFRETASTLALRNSA